MEVIQELEKLDTDLTKLKTDFNNQMNAIEFDLKEFHKYLIELSTKYPENKEILEFIVFINDRIETSQTNMKEILGESLNELISIKQQIIKQSIKSRQLCKAQEDKKETFWSSMADKFGFKELKWVIGGIAVIGFLTMLYISPDIIFTTFDWIMKIKG